MRQEDGCLPLALRSEPQSFLLEGAQFYRKMRTPSQPALLRGSDDKLHVVKWSNPAHRPHILAGEVIGHALLTAVGLPVAPWKPFFASDAFIEANPQMWPQFPSARRRIEPGLHFASEFLGTERTGTVFELLPLRWREFLSNADDLLGAYIFDIWTAAGNPRKTIFRKQENTRKLRAFFVDNSELFGGPGWKFSNPPAAALNYNLRHYIADWNQEAVTSWISKFRARAPSTLKQLPELVPPCWRGGNVDALAETLSKRLESLDHMAVDEFQRVGLGRFIKHECARHERDGPSGLFSRSGRTA